MRRPAAASSTLLRRPVEGSDLLAVLQLAARDSGDVRVDAPDGRRLALLPLPYALPDDARRAAAASRDA